MSYSISSDKFQDPLLKPILVSLSNYFSSVDVDFYVIGATARDIVLNFHGEKSGRATRDLDIAIAISNWEEFETIEQGIVNIKGFKKDSNQKQRFIYQDNFELDIVPFGDIMKEDDKVFWTPDEQVAMSVLGFKEVAKATDKFQIDNGVEIEVASLVGVFILKLVAWQDRNNQTNKDADDIAFIISNYFNINQERAITEYSEIMFEDDDFSFEKAGALLIGIDVALLLGNSDYIINKLIKIVEKEIGKQEESVLLNQIIETNSNFNYEETLSCLMNFIRGVNANQKGEITDNI